MFKNIYKGKTLKIERDKAKFVLKQLLEHFTSNPHEMPLMYEQIAEKEGIKRGVADYIAGMSDDYCLVLFNNIFVPKVIIN